MKAITGTRLVIAVLIAAAFAMAFWMDWPTIAPGPDNQTSGPLLSGNFTLAASWEPAFCETQPQKPECTSQTPQRFDAQNFALHGLWPEPASLVYCSVPVGEENNDRRGDWAFLPKVKLTAATRTALDEVMPGTQSNLQRHEWIKHGTCSGGDAERYFTASLQLMAALNQSRIRDLFQSHIGKTLTADAIRQAFDDTFGKGTGKRVTVECARTGGRTMISELRISLQGDIRQTPSLAYLTADAPTRSRGCPAGEIDPAGHD